MSKSILLLLMALVFRVALPAQTTTVTTAGAHDPAFLNHVYFWAPDSLLALEKTSGEMKAKMKALGFGGGGSAYVLQVASITMYRNQEPMSISSFPPPGWHPGNTDS